MRFFLAIFFIAGFSIGAGFLALTAVVGLSGFYGGLISIILVWLLNIASGLLYIEAFLAVPEAGHLTTLCHKLTGRMSTYFTGWLYVLFNYVILTIGYIFLYNLFHMSYADYSNQHPYLVHFYVFLICCFFGALIYFGQKITLFFATLFFLIFLCLFSYGAYHFNLFIPPKIELKPYPVYVLFAIGAIFNYSFYQSVLPTVIQFLKRDRQKLIYSVWVGYTFAMIILLIWLWLTIRPGIYSDFLAAFESKSAYTRGFSFLEETTLLKVTFRFLVTCAATVSILAVGISLIDFFEDTFFHSFRRKKLWKLLFIALIFFPGWYFSLIFHDHFMIFSTLFTSFVEVFLALVFPLQWVWNARYHLSLPVKPVLFGGRKMLVGMVFATVILFLIVGTIPIHLIDL